MKVVIQKKLLGSGDAAASARGHILRHGGDVLVMCADMPLVSAGTLKELIRKHRDTGAGVTVLTAEVKDTAGYGRILRGGEGRIEKIVEDEDASSYGNLADEVNTGVYCFDAKALISSLESIRPDNSKKEFFLTDTIEVIRGKGGRVESSAMKDPGEMIGVNSRRNLAEATMRVRALILDEVMDGGVTVEDPLTTTIYPGALIGRDTVIRPNTFIGPEVKIGKRCSVGPFARLTARVSVGDEVVIGNFVELVRSSVGDGARIKHHTYLGDTKVGKGANIGAGVITANYDGTNKNRTVIGAGAFIGVGARLIAPVSIGPGAVVGAGCVVLRGHNVPSGATAVGVPARILKKRKVHK
jgi:bifunctional UDP-N-acetylglucosamine pyrophosphorylase/glucosamine-1-phosphate N-acetyltransferase